MSLFIVVVFLSCFNLFAQDGINTHLFSFSETLEAVSLEDGLGVQSLRQQSPWLMRLSYDHVNDPIIGINNARNARSFDVVDQLQTFTLGASHLYSSRFLLGFSLPIHQIQSNTLLQQSQQQKQNSTVLGDIVLKAKWRLSSDQAQWNVALVPELIFPSGDQNLFVSDDSLAVGLKLATDRDFRLGKIFLNAGYAYAANAQFANIDRREQVHVGVGAYIRFSETFGANIESILEFNPNWDKDQNPFQNNIALQGRWSNLHAFLGVGQEGFRNARSHDFSFFLGFKTFIFRRPYQQGHTRTKDA